MTERLPSDSNQLAKPDYHEPPDPVGDSPGALQGVGESQMEKSGWAQVAMPLRLMEMLQKYDNSTAEGIGWCLLCDSLIRSERDLIANTNTHKCERRRQSCLS